MHQITCVGYCRVSTERQAGETFTSIADQEKAILELADRFGLEVGAWYRDEGVSGATAEQRPAFSEMLAYCQANPRPSRRPGLVLVLNDSRWGRFDDPEEAAYWRHHLRRLGWLVRYCEGDDVEDITFRSVIRSLGSAQASEYRRNIQRNARRGAKSTAEQGYWGREAPFGYRRMVAYPPGHERVLEIGALKAPNERVKLTPHPEEAKIVRWIFETYASGTISLGGLVEELRRRVPERKWSRTAVNHMLKNPAYVGDVRGGRRRAGGAEQLVTPIRSESEWYGKRDAHEPIVSRELFAAVGRRLKANKLRSPGPRTLYLLSGVMTCVYCESHFVGGGIGGRDRRTGKKKYIYRDTGGIERICPGRIGTVMRHLIDSAVVSTVANALKNAAVQRQIRAELGRVLHSAPAGYEAKEAALEEREAQLYARRERLVAAIADGTIERGEATSTLEKIRQDLQQVTADRARLQHVRQQFVTSKAEHERLVELALDFPRIAKHIEGPELRELVLPWIASATFDKAERVLSLGIRRVPAVGSFSLSSLPGQAGQEEGRPFRRRINLLQPGHEARAQRAREQILHEIAARSAEVAQ